MPTHAIVVRSVPTYVVHPGGWKVWNIIVICMLFAQVAVLIAVVGTAGAIGGYSAVRAAPGFTVHVLE